MKIKIEIKPMSNSHILVFFLCVLLLGSSCEALIGTTYVDEVVLVILIGYLLVVKKNINKYMGIAFLLFLGTALLGMLNNRAGMIDLIDLLKPLTMFLVIYSLHICDEERDIVILIFKIVNSISIFVGILNYVQYNLFHKNLLLNTGSYKYIDGVIVHRMSGFMLHSGFMAETCAALIIITLMKNEFSKIAYLEIIYYYLGLYCTRGRLPLFIASCFIIIFFLNKLVRNKKIRFIIIILLLSIAIIMLVPTYKRLLLLFSSDLENQIRFKALRSMNYIFEGSLLSVLKQIILGFGIGTLTTYYESNLAIVFMDMGLVGIVLWYFPFIYALYKMRLSKSKYSRAAVSLACYYLLNTIVNKSYSLPLFEITCLMYLSDSSR